MAQEEAVPGTDGIDQSWDFPHITDDMVSADGKLGEILPDMPFCSQKGRNLKSFHIHLKKCNLFTDVLVKGYNPDAVRTRAAFCLLFHKRTGRAASLNRKGSAFFTDSALPDCNALVF